MRTEDPIERRLLLCGVGAALGYVATDLLAGLLSPGYRLRSQAVSELFALGAPTRPAVATLFSLCSLLLLAFGAGVWRAGGGRRWERALGAAFAGSAIVGLLLWIAFPMHLRGAARSFTDTMHLILASNPFVLLSLGLAMAAFPGRLRLYTALTAALMVATAVPAFGYAPALDANLPTPWLGALERASQYSYELWQGVLAVVLWGRARLPGNPPAPAADA